MTGIAIDEVTTSADRPEYQARMVANAANEPGWFKYLNAYKFRQDRGGHGTKVSPRIPFPIQIPFSIRNKLLNKKKISLVFIWMTKRIIWFLIMLR